MLRNDKTKLLNILNKTKVFSKKELKIAEELMDVYLKEKKQKDYFFYVMELENKICGYVCFGPTPCTESTFDLYWIAVDPSFQGKGIGTKLLEFSEERIKTLGGKMIIIETSSTEKYKNTRKFYLARKYRLTAIIKDFYKSRDHKMIFTKNLKYSGKKESTDGKMEKNVA